MKEICGIYGFGEVYDRNDRESLWQELRKYDVGSKLFNGIQTMLII